MPKERINPSNHGTSDNPSPHVEVTWGRDTFAQVAVCYDDRPMVEPRELDSSLRRRQRDAIRSFLADPAYAPEAVEAIEAVREPSVAIGKNDPTGSGETEAIAIPRGLWCDLDRHGINRLIRTLRKARDQAYGADA